MKEQTDNTVAPFPVKLLTGALALSGLLLLGLLWSAYDTYCKVDTEQLNDLRIQELRGIIIHLDEVLTMSARMAAATGDLSWEQRYRQFEPQLDAAAKEAIQLTAQSGGRRTPQRPWIFGEACGRADQRTEKGQCRFE